jgi:hypothetical protein
MIEGCRRRGSAGIVPAAWQVVCAAAKQARHDMSETPEEERHNDWIVGGVVAVLIGILLFWVVDTPEALPGAPIEGPDPLPGAPIDGSEQCEVSTNGGGYPC